MNYKVYQGTELKQTVTSKTAVMNGLQPNKTYVFGVQPDNGQTGAVGANLIVQSDFKYGYIFGDGGVHSTSIDFYSENYIDTNGETVFTFSSPDYVFKGDGITDRLAMYDSNKKYLGYQPLNSATQTLSISNVAYIRFCINSAGEGNTTGRASDWLANHRYKLEKGSVATTYVTTTSVTTRGIRFNIPKTLTVGSTITLRYEDYPLGIVPIGNEPSGMFGGGNNQNLSAKVISTANGSSVVEVAGNVIEVPSFVDGDTFTAQPDGTYALFSEYKALYY
ncbi:hypothetical protein AB0Y04_02750 [Loigolactobacillus coryniformis]|uniref:hypothetical protein n=1 Tax=Loigolactobacillus coryniformis TaxID=1610 RepID=UPI003F1F7390